MAERARPVTIAVVGSINLDLVANVERLPVAGETVTGATLNRYPGGKGANQALAARRLGAYVKMFGRVGADATAEAALVALRAGGVDLDGCVIDEAAATGIAVIAVDAQGENQIIVAPGANRRLTSDAIDLAGCDALICQLEVPLETIYAVASDYDGLFCLNVAPAAPVPEPILRRADVLVMNETESAFMGAAAEVCSGMIVLTHGAAGAEIRRHGAIIARAVPPRIEALDTTAAGDAFTAALVVRLAEGASVQAALDFACTAGAMAATRHGAQPSLPTRAEVEACQGS